MNKLTSGGRDSSKWGKRAKGCCVKLNSMSSTRPLLCCWRGSDLWEENTGRSLCLRMYWLIQSLLLPLLNGMLVYSGLPLLKFTKLAQEFVGIQVMYILCVGGGGGAEVLREKSVLTGTQHKNTVYAWGWILLSRDQYCSNFVFFVLFNLSDEQSTLTLKNKLHPW